MSTAFYTTATTGDGNSSKARLGLGYQTAKNIPATSFTDVRWNGSQFAPTFNEIPAQKIDGTGVEVQGVDAKCGWSLAALDFGDYDLGDITHKRVLGSTAGYTTTTNPTTGVYKHVIATDQTSGTACNPYFSALLDHRDGYPFRAHNVAFKGWEIGAVGGQNVKLMAPFEAGSFDYFGLVTKTTGSGTILPTVRGFPPTETLAADGTDKNARVKVISAAGKTFKIDVGATSFAGPTYTAVEGSWSGLPLGLEYDAANAVWGIMSDLGEIYWPTAIFADCADNDVFTVAKRRVMTAASFSTSRVISETQCRAILSGTEVIPLDGGAGWKITCTKSVTPATQSPGGRQLAAPFVRQDWRYQLQVERKFVDQTLQIANMGRTATQWVFEMNLDSFIGSSTQRYRTFIVVPSARALNKPTFSVLPGGKNETETYTYNLTSGGTLSYGGVSYTAPLTIVAFDGNSNIAT